MTSLSQMIFFNYGREILSADFHTHIHKQRSATLYKRKIRLDAILKKIIKRQLPFLIGGTITGIIMTYYYGFLFSIIVNSAIWMLISFIVNKYYYKSSTGFKDEKHLLQYGLALINTKTRRS
jgi:ABC-type transport system involved in Fe-S cluster assembly fused permease/ATPase subunit